MKENILLWLARIWEVCTTSTDLLDCLSTWAGVTGWGGGWLREGPGKWVINPGLHLWGKGQVSVSWRAQEAVALHVLSCVYLAYLALRRAQQEIVTALRHHLRLYLVWKRNGTGREGKWDFGGQKSHDILGNASAPRESVLQLFKNAVSHSSQLQGTANSHRCRHPPIWFCSLVLLFPILFCFLLFSSFSCLCLSREPFLSSQLTCSPSSCCQEGLTSPLSPSNAIVDVTSLALTLDTSQLRFPWYVSVWRGSNWGVSLWDRKELGLRCCHIPTLCPPQPTNSKVCFLLREGSKPQGFPQEKIPCSGCEISHFF